MAYDYNGTDHYATLGEAPLTATGNPCSIALWFKPAATDAGITQVIGCISANGHARLAIEILQNTTTNNGRLQFATLNQFNNGQAAIAPSALTPGEWHHAVGVCAVLSTASLGTRRVYLNGSAATAQNTANQAYTATFNNFRIANRKTATPATSLTGYFGGGVAEVAVYDAALDLADIEALASGAKPTSVRPEKLSLYLPLAREVGDLMEKRAITNTYVIATAAAQVVPQPRRFG